MASELILIGGGARSGKSRLALERALRCGETRAFVATAVAFDDEMAERIARHRGERQASFETLEAPTNLNAVQMLRERYDVILLDCLTLYVSNFLMAVPNIERLTMAEACRLETECWQDVQQGIQALRARCQTLIVVTNEVGQGVVPVSRLGRLFRDVAGRINQSVAAQAAEVWLCAFGQSLRLKPSLCSQNPID
jgi:adenosylcobinamide kinase / adenosylcobinamide-phosphate guanylyltransferase